ncbi:hypothetical protein EYF80_065848 [Liparis tanakae]|uniref:Uncharacterized protein n=1 Tax=Liparis tanakae TaxID=230148 RepID=A0A4Z2E5J0_9TELE|nr:hypothetical protein EYF80_065848 [Liparis tanakae]
MRNRDKRWRDPERRSEWLSNGKRRMTAARRGNGRPNAALRLVAGGRCGTPIGLRERKKKKRVRHPSANAETDVFLFPPDAPRNASSPNSIKTFFHFDSASFSDDRN